MQPDVVLAILIIIIMTVIWVYVMTKIVERNEMSIEITKDKDGKVIDVNIKNGKSK